MVARIVLGVFAVAALLFGAYLVALYLGGPDVPLPADIHEWGLVPGPLALGIWCGGTVITWDFVQQLRLGALCSILMLLTTMGIGHVVSLLADEGVARAYLKIGVYGAVQVIVAAFLVRAAAKTRWPAHEAG